MYHGDQWFVSCKSVFLNILCITSSQQISSIVQFMYAIIMVLLKENVKLSKPIFSKGFTLEKVKCTIL